MKLKFLPLAFMLICQLAIAQDTNQKSKAFDFWLGDWELSWYGQDSTMVIGSNSIQKILDNTVIQENFNSPSNGFKGMSLSVYNPKTHNWHQAWADNQGGYFDFIGLIDGDKRIFTTDTSQLVQSRMVFYEIEKDSFKWDWENTKDGGKSYTLLWRINYQRKVD